MQTEHLYLVDGSSYIFRAYHALPPLTRKSDGLPTGAVSGFCAMLWRLITQPPKAIPRATHIAVIFDAKGDTFRNRIYADYKANRPPAPEELRAQFGLIHQAVNAFGLHVILKADYEADDLIAAYTKIATQQKMGTTIISSDKDLMQLVNDQVVMFDTMKDKLIDIDGVHEKFGVEPARVVDVQALAGDSVDNVPGVPGIGIKTAAQLIKEFGNLDQLLADAGSIKQNKRRENLLQFADQARISRELVRLEADIELDWQLDTLRIAQPDAGTLIPFLKAMEFTTLTNRIAQHLETDPEPYAVAAIDLGDWSGPAPDGQDNQHMDAPLYGYSPTQNAQSILAKMQSISPEGTRYELVQDTASLERWVEAIYHTGHVAVDTETNSLDPMQADLVGISLSVEPGAACYIPLLHKGSGASHDLFEAAPQLLDGQLSLNQARTGLGDVLADTAILKIGQNIKFDMHVLAQHQLWLANCDDTMLMSYVLNSGLHGHGMDVLSQQYLNHTPIAYSSVTGTGRDKITFDFVPLDRACRYAAEDADITLRLWHVLRARLVSESMMGVYTRLEKSLLPVLEDMERNGIAVDPQMLNRLSGEFAQKMAAYEDDIYHHAGERFNIGSPKQLGEILFEKHGLEGGKKTKTGAWSTSANVLEDLATAGHALPKLIVEWRQLSKLRSTYTQALPNFIHPITQRIHTSYAMASTSTGRLSSSDPNLQNIPIRTAEGRRIREAFISQPGHLLISADYSQIELRLLAEIADISSLKTAFRNGLDIHAMTASEVFDTPIEGMDPGVRRQAKAINFGIIYGMSAFGLAAQLGISRSEAKDVIERYFQRFPGILDYMETTKKRAREQGHVTTLFGRKIHFPDIDSGKPAMRQFFERAAINAPIQGSAADIIRRAMVQLQPLLAQQRDTLKMLLQIHDELVFEVHADKAMQLIPMIQKIMAGASMPALKLDVTLEVEARAAENWHAAH